MPKIMEIIEKETKGKSYHTYKYSYDSIGLPSIDYDDDPNKIMKWKDSGETGSPKKSIDLKPLADQLKAVGEKPLLKYFLDGSRHVFKVDDIAYNKQVFPVVAGQIVVKVEKIMMDEEIKNGIDSDVIDLISANIINERNPTCYSTDRRFLKSRLYSDYKALISDNPDLNIVQMDTVYNDVKNGPFIQTFKFIKYGFLFALLHE